MPRKKTSKIHFISNEELLKAIESATSIRNLMLNLGLRGGSTYALLVVRIKELDAYRKFSDSQFWNRGKTSLTDHRIKSKCSNEKVFSKQSILSTHRVKKLYLSTLHDNERCCSTCKLSIWLGKELPLELDHIDGDCTNHTLENIRLLCPNCHALTPTWRGRNKGKQKIHDDILLDALHKEKNISQALKSLNLSGAGNYSRCYRLLSKSLVSNT